MFDPRKRSWSCASSPRLAWWGLARHARSEPDAKRRRHPAQRAPINPIESSIAHGAHLHHGADVVRKMLAQLPLIVSRARYAEQGRHLIGVEP